MGEHWHLLKTEKPFRLLVGAGFIGGVGSYFFNVAVLSFLGTGALLHWIPPRTLGLAGGAFFAAVSLIAGTMLVRSRAAEEEERAQKSRA